MGKIFSIIFFIYVQNSTSIYGQVLEEVISKIDSLNKEKRQIEKIIQKYKNLKDQIDLDLLKLNEVKFQLELRKGLDKGVETTTTHVEGSLRDQPSLSGTEIIRIPPASKITVFNWYQRPYFKVSYKDKIGYLSYGSIKLTKLLDTLVDKTRTKQVVRKNAWRYPVTVVARYLGGNKLNIKKADLKVKENPKGEGVFVYSPKTRYYGVKRYIIWLVIDGRAYPLNGATKNITPSLLWPREAEKSTWEKTGLDTFGSGDAIKIVFGE